MKFKPKSEKEIAEANLWPKGDYAFQILEAEEAKSSKGNEMIKMKVKVFKDTGASQNIFDYLLGDSMEYKLRHIAEVAGLLKEYETGELEAYNLVGKTGWCKVGISKDKNGVYPDKNSIVDYLVNKPKAVNVVEDDSIPF